MIPRPAKAEKASARTGARCQSLNRSEAMIGCTNSVFKAPVEAFRPSTQTSQAARGSQRCFLQPINMDSALIFIIRRSKINEHHSQMLKKVLKMDVVGTGADRVGQSERRRSRRCVLQVESLT